MALNLSIVLTDSADRYPDRPALHLGESTVTYRELDVASNRAVNALTGLGLEPGQSVAFVLPNGLDFVLAYFGALKAGVAVVPLNVMIRAGELRHCLRDCGATMLIVGAEQAATAVPVAIELAIKHVYVTGERDVFGADGTFADLLAGVSSSRPRVDTDPGDTAVLLYTSGTTGRPKGAQLTHSGMLWVANTIATVAGSRRSSTASRSSPTASPSSPLPSPPRPWTGRQRQHPSEGRSGERRYSSRLSPASPARPVRSVRYSSETWG
jgi:long-chain acyl-CoA synthetase